MERGSDGVKVSEGMVFTLFTVILATSQAPEGIISIIVYEERTSSVGLSWQQMWMYLHMCVFLQR